MSTQRAAELQVVLEGVPLPAKKRDLIEYAGSQDESAAAELQVMAQASLQEAEQFLDRLARFPR